MNENIKYRINLDEIINNYKLNKETNPNHSGGNKYEAFPFTTDASKSITNFYGVVGAFSRMACGRSNTEEFNCDVFLDNMVAKIGSFEGEGVKDKFKDIIETLFIDDGKLISFNINTLNYIESTSGENKIAKYLYNNMFSEELRSLVSKKYDKEEKNILYKLALNSLPDFKEKEVEFSSDIKYLDYVKEIFIKDFKFLISNEELYKSSLKRFLEYYYMFYVSQLILKLAKFEKADLSNAEVLYYTLNWESSSKNRMAYKFGLELLKYNMKSVFSHSVVLDMLNHTNLNEKLGYVQLIDIFKEDEDGIIAQQLNTLINDYKKSIKDVDWSKFKYSDKDSGNEPFNLVYKLFELVDFQFVNGGRKTANEKYRAWFMKFIIENFAKKRGSLGYNLNLTEEDIILMTKLCINNNEKLKLNTLFKEFELRGMYFDRDSKEKIVQLYEKLNLLEKKSDSGDAQYVRSIL